MKNRMDISDQAMHAVDDHLASFADKPMIMVL